MLFQLRQKLSIPNGNFVPPLSSSICQCSPRYNFLQTRWPSQESHHLHDFVFTILALVPDGAIAHCAVPDSHFYIP